MDSEQNPNEEQYAPVKDLRKQIDACVLSVDKLTEQYGGSRALSLVRTKLEEAKMWGGKRLEELGSPFPKDLADKAE